MTQKHSTQQINKIQFWYLTIGKTNIALSATMESEKEHAKKIQIASSPNIRALETQ